MKKKTRIILVEDNPEYRKVIELAIKREPEMELAAMFGTAEAAMRSLESSEPGETADLMLLDLRLPGISGLEALSIFSEFTPGIKIIILTQSDREADVLSAISQGADGYLLKSATVTQIKDSIRTVIDGGASLDPKVAGFIMKTLQAKQPEESELALTERELEILQLLAEGLVKKEIAKKLDISFHTASSHIRHIYDKLKVPNAPAAINKAHQIGLFKPGS